MKVRILVIIMISVNLAGSAHGAKYSGEFLYLGAGGKPLALGGAFVADRGSVFSGYYNPAGLSHLDSPRAVFMHSETFGSLLNHDYIAYVRPAGSPGSEAGIGAALYRLGGGGIYLTGVDQNGRFYVVREESHADYAGYFSYGRGFGQLSAGISAKLIYRDILDESAFGIGLDLGALYTPADWLSLGLNFQDGTTTLLSYSTGTKESIYPTVKLGAMLTGDRGSFGTSLYMDSDIRFEGRDYAAQISAGALSFDSHFGLEIGYLDKIFARIGSDIGDLTLGAGLRVRRFDIDMALRDHSDLDNTFLVSLTARF